MNMITRLLKYLTVADKTTSTDWDSDVLISSNVPLIPERLKFFLETISISVTFSLRTPRSSERAILDSMLLSSNKNLPTYTVYGIRAYKIKPIIIKAVPDFLKT